MVTARDPYAPRFQIYVNNDLLPEEITQFIESVVVEDDAEMFDKIALSINALQYTVRGNVRDVLDSKICTPGNLIRVDMGYGNSLATVGAGEIVKVQPKFSRDGIKINIVAYDIFHRLGKRKNFASRNFNGSKLSDVFRSIVGDYPSATFVADKIPKDKDIVFKELEQSVGKSDYEFLKGLATRKGLDLFNEFDPKTQKFKIALSEPNDAVKRDFTFTYFDHDDEPFKTLYEFYPEMNSVDQITNVQFRNFDRKSKKNMRTFLTNTDSTTGISKTKFKGPDKKSNFKGGDGSEITFTAFGQHFELITCREFKTEKEAKIYAVACLKAKLNGFVTGSGVVIGVETLRARVVIELLGLSEAYNGNYYVNKVTHRQSDGQPYMTNIDCRKIVKLVN